MFVHGGWTDSDAWRFVAPELAGSFRVVTYDRRGHSRSERSPDGGTRRQEEGDLAALIGELGLGPVHVVGSSYGASIALGLAARRPDLVRSVVAHEPALLDIVEDPLLTHTRRQMSAIGDMLRAGGIEEAASRFTDELILVPGWWAQLPEATRSVMLANAGTLLDLLADPAWAALDLGPLRDSGLPIRLTDGGQSPAWLRRIMEALAEELPDAQRHTFAGAGHMPHITHPAELVASVRAFLVGGDA